MPFVTAISTNHQLPLALDEIVSKAGQFLGDTTPTLAILFYSPHHNASAFQITRRLQTDLKLNTLIGCSGEAVIGDGQEHEKNPVLTLWIGIFPPEIAVETFSLQAIQTADGISILGWPDSFLDVNPRESLMILFGDPYTFPAGDLFIQSMNEDFPGLPVLGGMASGMNEPGESILIRDGEVLEEGAVGVLIRGKLQYRTIVSQGARPIGEAKVITRGQDNIIAELSGQPPLLYVRDLFQTLSPRNQDLCRNGGLMIGIAMSEYREQFQRGDFLIRSLDRFDPSNGFLAIHDRIRVGQTVQFQLRDAESADEDLYSLLNQMRVLGASPQSALIFSCNGRGSRLFSTPNHDAQAIQNVCGSIPVAGFFAAGELGPVGGKNYMHGFTASIIIFEDL